MSKRSFLRKGASLVGGGALLSSAFMPGSSAGALTYKELCQNMLSESWSYFFAKLIAAVGITFWRTKIEEETFKAVPQRLKDNIKKLIDENFESDVTVYDAEDEYGGFSIDCYSWRFLNKSGVNLCLRKANVNDGSDKRKSMYTVYCYKFNLEGRRVIEEELCKLKTLEDASFDETSEFFEKLDYYVTLAKMRELLKNENLFSEKAANEQRTFKTKKNFYVQNKEVNFIQIYGDLDFVNGFKKKQQRKEDDFVQKNKEGENTLKYNLRLFIELKDGKFRESLQNVNDGGETIQKMTQYMKEILKQAEQKYGVKVLGTENKEQNKVDEKSGITSDGNSVNLNIVD